MDAARIYEPQPINVVCCAKGAERYVVLFDDQHKREAVGRICHMALRPDLSLTVLDAVAMVKKIAMRAI